MRWKFAKALVALLVFISRSSAEDSVTLHRLESPHQSAATEVRVLGPREPEEGKTYRVIYLLPVEAGRKSRYGDPIEEVKKLGLAEKHRVIFAAPTFAELPWYADHPTEPTRRQETYFLEDVLPLVEKNYPVVAGREGRLLLGFSKSGWGAWSLLLRRPERFARAAAWDAPLMMDRPGMYGSGPIFGSEENFARYRLSELVRASAERLRTEETPRLLLSGYGSFRGEHERMHKLLGELEIPHTHLDGPQRKHDWHSGWVADAVEWLVAE